jgi:hypothetical protein
MKDALAEKLLAEVLGWGAEDVARERPLLQAMAAFKYDEYEQYSPGMRFVESLARWLSQFEAADRSLAYRFVRERLVFCSSHEMNHLVETAYPDYVRPILLERVASELALNRRHVGRVAASAAFRVRQRQTLFLGLSDGARIDAFRRANRELDHEQIWQTHELSPHRVTELLGKLGDHVAKIDPETNLLNPLRFRTIVLLDDFSASGSSYFSTKDDGSASGKVAKFLNNLSSENDSPHRLLDAGGAELILLIYMATEKAITHLRSSLANHPVAGVRDVRVETVQSVPQTIVVVRDNASDFGPLIERYYDHSIHDVHLQKGGTADARYGYADCGLPVVLHHNTPNNSLALLWSYEDRDVRGLFPRVQRHREMS